MNFINYWLDFGALCRKELNLQCQYGYFYFKGLGGNPELGKGLRMQNDRWSHHEAEIHKDDAPIFIQRVKEYRQSSRL